MTSMQPGFEDTVWMPDSAQPTLREYLSHMSKAEFESKIIEQAILSALEFEGMDQRHENIPVAHANIFSWIFRSDAPGSWDSFVQWLEDGEEIYWINGKAASGKLTLMRYIFENEQLRTHLSTWRGDFSLATAKFYFWATGSETQKSQIGLFRSILYQILSKQPKLISESFPDLFAQLPLQPAEDVLGKLYQEPSEMWTTSQLNEVPKRLPRWKSWTLPELKDTFDRLAQNTSSSMKYFLLIDGLDEFYGDHIELTSFFKKVATSVNVKLCVSSRPLLVFDQQLSDYPRLRLQDLTVGDITRFVRDKLTEHPRFREISVTEELGALDFIDEIVQTSAGVFLWVSLVVKSIVQGLTNHDGVEDLRRRLRELPPELDQLYSLMLTSVTPPFYELQGAKLLQLVYQSPSPISLLELSFADDSDNALVLSDVSRTLNANACWRRSNHMSCKMRSRCAGLLETETAPEVRSRIR